MLGIDLTPAPAVVSQSHGLPDPDRVEITTPFWMAYYDGDENFMYVTRSTPGAARCSAPRRYRDAP